MKELFSLVGKSVLITGASSGIGRDAAKMIAGQGANVTIVGRDNKRLQETFESLEGDGHEKILADLTVKDDIAFLSSGKVFDGVVFNAGIVEYTPVKFINEEKIKRIFDTNFIGTVLLCQQLLKNRLIAKQGSLIFVSSISSKLGIAGTALYASSKAAVSAFSKVVAAEVSTQGIRSNSICPGIIITPMIEQARAASSSAQIDQDQKTYPLGYGSPGDVAGLVIFLLSDASRWMTGNDIILDGGLTLN